MTGDFPGACDPSLGAEPPAPGLPRVEHRPLEERIASGKRARALVPRERHAEWSSDLTRTDPVALLERQAATRVPELVPIRHGRMLVSPFTYYRGAALPMASDLAHTPSCGFTVQLCGDAHLSNFGIFGSPERHLVFDVNDFDESTPGPWEWDVKRLAASLEVACRENEYTERERAAVVTRCVRSYRRGIRSLARSSMLDVWYAGLDLDALLPKFYAHLDPQRTPAVWHAIAGARAHDSFQAFDKLCCVTDGMPRIISDPPLITPLEEIRDGLEHADVLARILDDYRRSLPPDRRHLLEQHRFTHLARKVVGVGSVGTNSWIALLLDRDRGTPLLLQIKEAEASVLEEFTSPSAFANHGQRVVMGQQLMQSASDIFLGWGSFEWDVPRDVYLRQLRDWKGSADIRGMTPAGMDLWSRMCGWTLARAHARSGDRVAIASYLGKSDVFDRAVAAFAVSYADQNERDYRTLQAAVDTGRLPAHTGL